MRPSRDGWPGAGAKERDVRWWEFMESQIFAWRKKGWMSEVSK
jgi:hypothetical protein